MQAALAIARKDLRLLVRDKASAFFAFVFPVIYASFFGAIFSGSAGGSGKMNVVVADEDGSAESKAFVETLRGASELNLSFAAAAEAEELVRRGDRAAFIKLPKGYGESRRRLFWGEPTTISVGVDPSRKAEGGMLEGLLMREFMQDWQKDFTNPKFMQTQIADTIGLLDREESDLGEGEKTILRTFLGALNTFMSSPLLASAPASQATSAAAGDGASTGYRGFEPVRVKIEDVLGRKRVGPKNAFAISFPQGMIWGVMGCAAGFGVSLVTERTRGTLTRLRTSAISMPQILLGKAIACFLSTVLVCAVMISCGWLFFGVQPTSIGLLALAIVSVAVGFVGVMMVLSVLGRTEQSAGGIGWAALTMLAMIGGGMVPAVFMPAWMQSIGSISPIFWAIRAFEGPIWRETSLVGMLQPCGILLAMGVGLFALGATIFNRTERA